MTRTRRRILALLGLALALPAGTCEMGPVGSTPTPPGQVLATVQAINGPAATVNGAPAAIGEAIRAGDDFRTGNATQMVLAFAKGGTMTLDANTDPNLIVQGACLVVSGFGFGHIFIDGTDICVVTPAADGTQHSRVDYWVRGGEVRITVLTGSFTLNRPQRVMVNASQQVNVANGVVQGGGARTLSQAEIQRTFGWLNSRGRPVPPRGLQQYQPPPPPVG
jgi:hypothetical protein